VNIKKCTNGQACLTGQGCPCRDAVAAGTIDSEEFRNLVMAWGGKYHSAFRAERAGVAYAYDAIIDHINRHTAAAVAYWQEMAEGYKDQWEGLRAATAPVSAVPRVTPEMQQALADSEAALEAITSRRQARAGAPVSAASKPWPECEMCKGTGKASDAHDGVCNWCEGSGRDYSVAPVRAAIE
jgi:hypothetical protein